MKIVAIIQARMGSIRLPNKVMKLIDGKPLIGLLLLRLSKSSLIDKIVLATSTNPQNAELVSYVQNLGYDVFCGDESDVLDRYYNAAKINDCDVVVRVTGDCPLIDPALVDDTIKLYLGSDADYVSNVDPPTYPDGLDVEVFSIAALEEAWQFAKQKNEREHVTPYIREKDTFVKQSVNSPINYSQHRWTVDEPNDFIVVKNIYNHFKGNIYFSWEEVIDLYDNFPKLFEHNKDISRNEGAVMGSGQKLWRRAKSVIPGGNMLLSKRSEMFLPEQWPSYFSRAKGCEIWDLDNNKYFDVSIMGIGTNILGYGHPEVDEAVKQTVETGNMATFNCPEEVWLAEKLTSMHPWADMARFARTGGEANAIAIRIARAFTKRHRVAICGYHGWHDWYLAANLQDSKGLDNHLLPGLNPLGVPEELRGSILPFHYNKTEELKSLIDKYPDIGVIFMEVSRSEPPKNDFLKEVRNIASNNNIVLIFDECTSGFRETFGGLHKKYDVEPDIAMFGKALGNGYAITAVIGRREVMMIAQDTFISSTFWTERIGPTAALATLDVMEREKSWEIITKTGNYIADEWRKLSKKHGLNIDVFGLPALICFGFNNSNAILYKTLITQEMLTRGFLAATSVYVSTAHTKEIIDLYLSALDEVFAMIAKCEDGLDVNTLLKGPVCHTGFQRLN
jgi:glutamate-1-semialdehyde 2,1-aminomutase